MGAAAGVSEPILFSVTEPRLGSLVLLLCALAAAVGVALILAGPHHRGRGWPLALRAFLGVCLVGLLVNGFRAGLRVASPPVQLKATERGLTSYVTVAHPSGIRLQLARHADAEGIFVPWQAMEALHLERLRCYDKEGSVADCEVLAITLRPDFASLREQGVLVAPGVRRSTLDLVVPVPPGGTAVLAQVRALQERFGGH
jgi:hypothetical protein